MATMIDLSKIPLPQATPETQHFWDGALEDELRLQCCEDCNHVYFPPRPFCPACASRSVTIQVASGRAKLHSYVINHRPHPAFDGPYAIAVVELEEGPRMMTNVVDVEQTPEALVLDMPLEVTFKRVALPGSGEAESEVAIPYFRPAGGAA